MPEETDKERLDAANKRADDLEAEVKRLRQQSAGYRVARNQALKEGHAMKQVLKSHNIKFNLEEADLTSVSIEDGKATGEFAYTAPKADTKAKDVDPKSDEGKGMTYDDVKGMSADKINANWKEVSAVLGASA